MLVKELRNEILLNHNFNLLNFKNTIINRSYIHKAKKDELIEILNILNQKKIIISENISNLIIKEQIIRYYDKSINSYNFIYINPSYNLSTLSLSIIETISKQINNNSSHLQKLRNKLINLELDIKHKYSLLNLNGGIFHLHKPIIYSSIYYNNEITTDITEYSKETLKDIIKRIKNNILIFDIIYTELSKIREYNFLCNIVDKNYNNLNLNNKELQIYNDALFKVGYGNMRYNYDYNNIEKIFNEYLIK